VGDGSAQAQSHAAARAYGAHGAATIDAQGDSGRAKAASRKCQTLGADRQIGGRTVIDRFGVADQNEALGKSVIA